jgi:hypothetical protein
MLSSFNAGADEDDELGEALCYQGDCAVSGEPAQVKTCGASSA